jgi:hypothetical protein
LFAGLFLFAGVVILVGLLAASGLPPLLGQVLVPAGASVSRQGEAEALHLGFACPPRPEQPADGAAVHAEAPGDLGVGDAFG